MSDQPRIGPDGKYAYGGPMVPGDKGGLYFGFTLLIKERQGVLYFGTPLTFLSGRPAETRLVVQKFRERIRAVFGEVSYPPTIGSLRVGIRAGMVFIMLPSEADMLVADIKVFLALADRLEAQANKLEGQSGT